MSAVRRGGYRALPPAGNRDTPDDRLAVDVDGKHAFGENLTDEKLAVGDGDVAWRMLENGRSTAVPHWSFVSVELDDAFDHPVGRIDDCDISGLGNAPIGDEQPTVVLEKMMRAIMVGKLVDGRDVQFVRFFEDQRHAAHVETCRLAEFFERILEKDVGVLGCGAGACLKTTFAEYDAAVGAEILGSAAQSVDGFLGNGLRPKLAFDDPATFLSELPESDVDVDVMGAPCP